MIVFELFILVNLFKLITHALVPVFIIQRDLNIIIKERIGCGIKCLEIVNLPRRYRIVEIVAIIVFVRETVKFIQIV